MIYRRNDSDQRHRAQGGNGAWSRRNGDKDDRAADRIARATGAPTDLLAAAVATERHDGQAHRVHRLVRYAVWRMGEIMLPRDPQRIERAGQLGQRSVAELVLEAIDARSVGESLAFKIITERLQQVMPWLDERHGDQCPCDDCASARASQAYSYDTKLAGVFARVVGRDLVLGIKAVPMSSGALRASMAAGGERQVLRLIFGHPLNLAPFIMQNEAWRFVALHAASLDRCEEDLCEVDEVRVWDNNNRSVDRYTIVMHGGDADEPRVYQAVITSSGDPRSFWMHGGGVFDLDEPPADIGRELIAWQELLPTPVLSAIWDERGYAIMKIPVEIATRWANLVIGGYFSG